MAPLTSEELRREHPNPSSLTLTLRAISDVSCLAGFSTLERLDLSCNNIRTLEGLGGCCGNLKWLSVAQNKLESLKGIEGLSRLTVLNAGQNMIRTIDEVSCLANLRALILNDNRISAICKLEPLKYLNTLVLSRNPIKDIGKSLMNVKSLTKISLSNCEVDEIGPTLASCVELKEARFANNHIATIPQQIVHNSKLQLLDLGKNAISRWSDLKVLSELHNLRNLNIQGNPIAEKDKIAKVRKLAPKLQIFNSKPIDKFNGTKKIDDGVTLNKEQNTFQEAFPSATKEVKRTKDKADPAVESVFTTECRKQKKARIEKLMIPGEAIKHESAPGHGETKSAEDEKNRKQKTKGSKLKKCNADTASIGKEDVQTDLRVPIDDEKILELGAGALEFDDTDAAFMNIVFSGKEEKAEKHEHDRFLDVLIVDPTKEKNKKKKSKKVHDAIRGRSALAHLPAVADVGTGGPSAWGD